MSTTRPRFSVVIPTRNRADTLSACLRTCLAQTFDDFEIVVSDNCGTPETRQVVESFSFPNLIYIRSEKPLAMSDNWELGISHSRGEYLTVLGDDDGLLFHALATADEMIRDFKVDVLHAEQLMYTWPGFNAGPIRESGLIIPVFRPPRRCDSERGLQAAIYHPPQILWLPSLYNAFVHRDVLDRLRAKTGRVFNDAAPDWYSGYAILMLTTEYVYSGVPLRIGGASAKSTGLALLQGTSNPVMAEYDELNRASGFKWNPTVPNIPRSFSALSAQCLQSVRDSLKVSDCRPRINKKNLVRLIRSELEQGVVPLTTEEWRRCLDELERFVASDKKLRWWYESTFGRERGKPPPWKEPQRRAFGLQGNLFTVDVGSLAVHDVYGAAELFGHMFSDSAKGLDVPIPPSPFGEWLSTTKDIVREFTPPALLHLWRSMSRVAGVEAQAVVGRTRAWLS